MSIREEWKNCTGVSSLNITKIFPTKQRGVLALVEDAKRKPQVEKIIIFGSSVTYKCNPWSDIDVLVYASDYAQLHGSKEQVYDIIYSFNADETLLKEVEKTGVLVYERHAT